MRVYNGREVSCKLVTLRQQSGSREEWIPVLSLLPPFYLDQDPHPQHGMVPFKFRDGLLAQLTQSSE